MSFEKRLVWSIRCAVAVMLAAGAGSCSRSAAPVEAKIVETDSVVVVPAVRVSRASIASKTVLTAEFQPFQEVDVMAKVAGYVRSIKVDLGDHVREGQVLAELEAPEMTDEVSKAAAVVEQTGAEIAAARDELQRAESAHQISHLSSTRLQEAAKREAGLIPQQELDEARSRDLVAEAQVASAKSRLLVEENRTRVARAEETRVRTMRNYVTVTAPFSGVVTKRYANSGSMIQAGTASQSQAMPVVRISQVSTLRLSLPVPESMASAIRVGQPVDVKAISLGRSFEGRVARFAARVDPSTRTMITEVDVKNSAGMILPGLYVEVSLQAKKRGDVLSVPLDALERSGNNVRAYKVVNGMIAIVPVQIGLEDATRAEILSGLQDADLVVTGRRAGLNAGDKVRPRISE